MDSNDDKSKVKVEIASDSNNNESGRSKLKNSIKKKISLPNGGLNQINENSEIDTNDIYLKLERSKSLDPTHAYEDFEQIRTRISSIMSIMSLGDMGGDAFVSETAEKVKNGKLLVSTHKLQKYMTCHDQIDFIYLGKKSSIFLT